MSNELRVFVSALLVASLTTITSPAETSGDNIWVGIDLKIDFALPYWTGTEQVADWDGVPIPETLKEGWIPWCAGRWGDMYGHGGVAMEDVGGTGVSMMINTVYGGLSALKVCGMCMPRLNGGTPYGSPIHDPICNSWYQVEDHPENPSGDIVMALYGLPAGEYELYSYHNNFECHRAGEDDNGTPACCDLIANPQPLMPSITAVSLADLLDRYSEYDWWARWADPRNDFIACIPRGIEWWDHPVCEYIGDGVETIEGAYNVQVQQVTSDDELIPSLVRFRTNGSAVHIIYESGCCTADGIRPSRVGGRAILNAFELRIASAEPVPSDGAVNLPLDTILYWPPVAGALEYDVYLGTNRAEVSGATAPSVLPGRGRQSTDIYDPGGLQVATTYYWRIDGVNPDGSVTRGGVWSFTTVPCGNIDDFESYDNTQEMLGNWQGFGGSEGHLSLSTQYARGGNPAMHNSLMLEYNNAGPSQFSEVCLTFDSPQDWTASPATLAIFFRGEAVNHLSDSIRTYVIAEDADGGSKEAGIQPMNLTRQRWQPWGTHLAKFRGVDLKAVKRLYIGVGDRNGTPTGAYGVVYIDDIGLCMPSCIPEVEKIASDHNVDCIVNFEDHAIAADGFDGTSEGWKSYAEFAAKWLNESLWP